MVTHDSLLLKYIVVVLFLILRSTSSLFFFFNDTATTEIYTLSLPRRSSDLVLEFRSIFYVGVDGESGTDFFRQISPSVVRSEEHTSELQSRSDLVCRLLLEKKKRSCTFIWGRSTPPHYSNNESGRTMCRPLR